MQTRQLALYFEGLSITIIMDIITRFPPTRRIFLFTMDMTLNVNKYMRTDDLNVYSYYSHRLGDF